MDGGGEFKKQFACANCGLVKKKTTPHNPQGNSVVEWTHQVIGNSLRCPNLENKELDETDPFGPFLSGASWAVRSTHHTILKATPGQSAFGRDMLLGIQFKADWATTARRRQEAINKSNAHENASRTDHNYKVGDYALVQKPGILRKTSQPRMGPCQVIKVYANGNVRIQEGATTKRYNIQEEWHVRRS